MINDMKKDSFEHMNTIQMEHSDQPVPETMVKDYFDHLLSHNYDKILTYRRQLEHGYVDHTMYPFLPGILVYLNDVHSTYIPIDSSLFDDDSLFLINYCITGRCEFRVSDNVYRYMKDNYTSIGSLTISDTFYYPSDHYLGFEIYISQKHFTNKTISALRRFHIDMDSLYTKYNNREKLTILETDPSIHMLWMELYNTPNPDTGMILLNVAKILYYLSNNQKIIPASSSYLTPNHARLAKEVHDILTADLSRHISMREISDQMEVSETSLKNYFSAMFGMSVSEYMKELRLQHAAKLLSDSGLPISEVANQCGYSNQGRFARAFKETYGMLPLEYRHCKNTN